MVYEDFTTYTEVDTGAGDISYTGTNQITHTTTRADKTYLYKDFNAGHFTNIDFLLKLNFVSSDNYGLSYFTLLANAIGDEYELQTAGEKIIMPGLYQGSTGQPRIYLWNYDGASKTSDYYNIAKATDYYIRFTRVGTTGTIYIYSDEARTVLLDTLSLTVQNDAFRYLYACNSQDDDSRVATAVADYINLDLQEVTPTTSDKNIPNYFNSKYITSH